MAIQHRIWPSHYNFAKRLRKEPNLAEQKLWALLREQKTQFKFRRQQPIGPYIVDFVCLTKKFIIEIDGTSHEGKEKYDAGRDEYFKQQGFALLHIPHSAAIENADGVLETILKELFDL